MTASIPRMWCCRLCHKNNLPVRQKSHGPREGPYHSKLAERYRDAMARQKYNNVMLSKAKHLDTHRDRPFAALRVTRSGAHPHNHGAAVKYSPVILSAAKHLLPPSKDPSLRSG